MGCCHHWLPPGRRTYSHPGWIEIWCRERAARIYMPPFFVCSVWWMRELCVAFCLRLDWNPIPRRFGKANRMRPFLIWCHRLNVESNHSSSQNYPFISVISINWRVLNIRAFRERVEVYAYVVKLKGCMCSLTPKLRIFLPTWAEPLVLVLGFTFPLAARTLIRSCSLP
jgi:hypothetical protein